jgi:hypothetical protein
MVDEDVHHVRRLEEVHQELHAVNVFTGCPLGVGTCKGCESVTIILCVCWGRVERRVTVRTLR